MKVLVVVDMQNDFIDGILGTPEAQMIVPKVVEKIEEYSNTGAVIFATKDTHYEDYLLTQEGKNLPIPHCIFNSDGWSLNDEVADAIERSDYYFHENCVSSNGVVCKETFGSADLANYVVDLSEDEEVDEIILVGVCTDICVISNAMLLKAACPGALITVDASCCAGVTPESHKIALEAMKACQINII